MKRNYLFLLFCIVVGVSSFNSNAQSIKPKKLLKRVDTSLNNIQTVVYKIQRIDKSFTSKDTIQRTAVCSLYLAPKDKMKAYHIIDRQRTENILGHHKYDGSYSSYVFYKKDSLDFEKSLVIANVLENNYFDAKDPAYYYDLKDYFGKKRAFRQYNSLLAKLILLEHTEVTESTFMNTPVYVLTFYSKNMEKKPNHIDSTVVTHYIRKSDFLPIGYKAISKFENMEEYEYYKIDYLAINPDIPLETFKVDTTLTEIQPKSIYERVKKYDL